MAEASLKLGDGNWGVKEDSLLGYNDENGNYKPIPFDFSRASIGTRVNRDGLIEVVQDNIPRIDFSDGEGSLLLEPQRTNVLLSSENWSTNWTGTNRLVTANDIISPDGYQNADKLSAVGGTAYYAQVRTTASGANTFSIFLKYGDKTTQSIYAYSDGSYFAQATFNLQTGTVDSTASGTASIENYGNGWYRCIVSGTAGTSTIEVGIEGIAVGTYTYAWGAQLEEGSYSTSLIPTSGSAVTRVGDSALGQSISLGNSHTIFFNGELNTIDNNKVFIELITSSSTTSATIRNVIGTLRLYNQIDSNYPLGGIQSTNNKWVMRIDGNNYTLFYNNAGTPASQSGTFATARDMDRINLNGGFTEYNTKQVLAFPTALTDSECIALITL